MLGESVGEWGYQHSMVVASIEYDYVKDSKKRGPLNKSLTRIAQDPCIEDGVSNRLTADASIRRSLNMFHVKVVCYGSMQEKEERADEAWFKFR